MTLGSNLQLQHNITATDAHMRKKNAEISPGIGTRLKENRVNPIMSGQHSKHVTATFNKDFIDKIVPGNKPQIGGFTPSLGSRNAKQQNVNAKKLVGHAHTGNEGNMGISGINN